MRKKEEAETGGYKEKVRGGGEGADRRIWDGERGREGELPDSSWWRPPESRRR